MKSNSSDSPQCSIRVKTSIFLTKWPWNLTDDITKQYGAPFPCHFKLCGSFHSHLWIQTGITVRKRSVSVQIADISAHVTLIFGKWPQKIIGHLCHAPRSYVCQFIAICVFKLELCAGNTQIGAKFFLSLWPWSLSLTYCMDITFVNDNNSWKLHDNPMAGNCEKVIDGQTHQQTDRLTYRIVHRAAWLQLI